MHRIENTLRKLGVRCTICHSTTGPLVTTFNFKATSKSDAKRAQDLQDDLGFALGVVPIRVFISDQDKTQVVVEVPHLPVKPFWLGEFSCSKLTTGKLDSLPIPFGVDTSGKTVCHDLVELQHLFVCGDTQNGADALIELTAKALNQSNASHLLKLMTVGLPKNLAEQLRTSIRKDVTHFTQQGIKEAFGLLHEEIIHRQQILKTQKVKSIQEGSTPSLRTLQRSL